MAISTAAAAAARRCPGFRAPPSSLTVGPKIWSSIAAPRPRPRPAAMHLPRRAMSDKIDPAVREELRRLDGEIRALDGKIFARFKEVALDNSNTVETINALSNKIHEAERKMTQEYVTKLISNATTYYKRIHSSWKISFAMMTVSGAVGYVFLREVKEGWQNDCAKDNEKTLEEKAQKMKEEIITELSTLFGEKKSAEDEDSS